MARIKIVERKQPKELTEKVERRQPKQLIEKVKRKQPKEVTEKVEQKQPEELTEKVEQKGSKKLTGKVKRKKPKEISLKKAVVIVPRLRLEPTLKPKKESKPITEDAKLCQKQAVVKAEKLPDLINFEPAKNTVSYPTEEDSNYYSNVSLQERQRAKKRFKAAKKGKNIYNARLWRDTELLNITTGLQVYGFRETKKIAELVKTKDEIHVDHFINRRTNEVTRIRNHNEEKRRGRPGNSFTKVSAEHLPSWPNARKWRRMTHEQMLAVTKTKDYSRSVITDLVQRFYDEEEESSDPQVMNVKAIYKYLLDCLAGQIPPQLPPKESALVLDLLRDARLLPLVYDFQEEKTFLENYKEATRYKPFQIKDEFKKKFCNANIDMLFDRNCVSVPEEIFMNLSRHKRVVQSFNPLVIPVWMMQKEQEYLEKFI